ncbi:MAG: hypothetical protein B7Z08_05565 [Sphingomonadales bacterium 32-68-7]|nr:MAG: hypothetical protein B7Z08_05565 [Sphingomonadales bacterium 32-68-7]
MFGADRLAYFAVMTGSAVYAGSGISGWPQGPSADGLAWYLVAVPLLVLGAYTVWSGLRLRLKAARLGDFGTIDRSSIS